MNHSNQPPAAPDREARSRVARAAVQSIWAACLVFLVALLLLIAVPQARAVPIVDDFSLGDGGWTGTPVGKFGLTPPAAGGKRWTYANPLWSVNWSPVDGPLFATGNYLTSGTINPSQAIGGDGRIDAFRISISHKFDFGSSINGIPPGAGQIAYKINGDPWKALPASAFQQGTLTNFTPASPLFPTSSPFLAAAVDQTTLVAPSFVPPLAPYSDLFPLINGGGAFTGKTPGYTPTGGNLVPSVAIVSLPELILVTNFQLRLINANLGSHCASTSGWDVRLVQADFAAPEPGTLLLAAVGISGAVGFHFMKRKRRHRKTFEEARGCPEPVQYLASRPIVIPCTQTLPPVSVEAASGCPGQIFCAYN